MDYLKNTTYVKFWNFITRAHNKKYCWEGHWTVEKAVPCFARWSSSVTCKDMPGHRSMCYSAQYLQDYADPLPWRPWQWQWRWRCLNSGWWWPSEKQPMWGCSIQAVLCWNPLLRDEKWYEIFDCIKGFI